MIDPTSEIKKIFYNGQELQISGSSDPPVIAPLSVTANGTYTAPSGTDGYSPVTVNVSGVTPTGNIDITTTDQVDVTNYATAKVVDADLVAANIKKNVNILGVTGTYEGGSAGGAYDILATIVGGTQSLAITDASGGGGGFELVGTFTPTVSASNFFNVFFKSGGFGYKAKYTNGMVLIKSSEESFARNGFIEGIFVYNSTYYIVPAWIGCRTGYTTPMQTSSRVKTARTDTGANAYIDSAGTGLGSNTYYGTISGADFNVYEMEIPQEIADMLMIDPE